MFQPAKFHNLQHELAFKTLSAVSIVFSLFFSISVGLYYFSTYKGIQDRFMVVVLVVLVVVVVVIMVLVMLVAVVMVVMMVMVVGVM